MALTVGVASVFAFLLYSLLGALTRGLFGIYKVYKKRPAPKLMFDMLAVEVVASVFFGMFSAMLLQELGWLKVSTEVIALLSGFFGADLIGLVSKKVGLSKGIQVIITEEQMDMLGLNERQRKGVQYINKHGSITNDIYQELNNTSHSSAKRDLSRLVEKKKVKRSGTGKATYYFV